MPTAAFAARRLGALAPALAWLGAGMAATGLHAQPAPGAALPFTIESRIYAQHRHGAAALMLEPAQLLASGDTVVTVLHWQGPAAAGLTVTSALPPRLRYIDSAQSPSEVSVDGGRSWGQLASLRVGGRPATSADITHVRWRLAPPQLRGHAGDIIYSGLVR